MDWNRDKSVKLSKFCVLLFAALLAAVCLFAPELFRLLKKGGIFITEQVGAENDRELVRLLLNDVPKLPFPNQYLEIAKADFEAVGFETLEAEEAFRPIKFWDVGALVWFARIIEWEFPGFCVSDCLDNLYHAQEILEKTG